MNHQTCLDDPLPGVPRHHAWISAGLDIVADTLCTTRRCVWCGLAEHRGYQAPPKTWRPTP